MDGTDPTTTVPAVAGGSHLVMVLILTLLAAVLSPIAMRVFYRSLRPSAGSVAKAVAGALCAVLAFDLAVLVAVASGNIFLAILVGLVGLAAVGYAVPVVRVSVRGFAKELHHGHKPPDHSHV